MFDRKNIKTLLLSLGLCIPVFMSSCERTGQTTQQLEERIIEVREQISTLPSINLNTGVAPIGGRTFPNWFEIILNEPAVIDEVILISPVSRNTDGELLFDSFPTSFIITGISQETGEVVKLYENKDTSDLLPRIAPVIIQIPNPVAVKSVKIEAFDVTPRIYNNEKFLAFAEVMLYEKNKNVALRSKVKTFHSFGEARGWGDSYIVDGIIPYVMNTGRGEQSIAYIGRAKKNEKAQILIDLKGEQDVDGMNLHAVDQSDNVPQIFSGDFGMPKSFTLEAATAEDLSDRQKILDVNLADTFSYGPILSWNFKPRKARYLILTILDPYVEAFKDLRRPRVGFAEIEITRGGNRLSEPYEIHSNMIELSNGRMHSSLVDGRNYYGEILPIKAWLEKLALRHDLELEEVRLRALLERKYSRQKVLLRLLIGAVVFLLVSLFLLYLWQQQRLVKQEEVIRNRVATNLHDELGANLHALSNIGDLIQESQDEPAELPPLVNHLHNLTEKTSNAVRVCSNMLKNRDLYEDLTAEFQRLNGNLLTDLEVDFHCEGGEHLNSLPRKTRLDLLLFYKECLANIIQHSDARSVKIHLFCKQVPLRWVISLMISDDGKGLQGNIPNSLLKRARYLRAGLKSADGISYKGAQIDLSFSRWNVLR